MTINKVKGTLNFIEELADRRQTNLHQINSRLVGISVRGGW